MKIEIPKGYRRLKRGEKIKPTDLAKLRYESGWMTTYHAGCKLISGYVIRKIKKSVAAMPNVES